MKVAIGRIFGLSDAAVERCIALGMTCSTYQPGTSEAVDPNADFVRCSENDYWYDNYDIRRMPDDLNDKWLRTHPIVIQVIEEMGEKAAATFSTVKIVEIPFNTFDGWHIVASDEGYESVHEDHRVWE